MFDERSETSPPETFEVADHSLPINPEENPRQYGSYRTWYRMLSSELISRGEPEEEHTRRLEAAERLEVFKIPRVNYFPQSYTVGSGSRLPRKVENVAHVSLDGRLLPDFEIVQATPKTKPALDFVLDHLDECPPIDDYLRVSAASALQFFFDDPRTNRETGTLVLSEGEGFWRWSEDPPGEPSPEHAYSAYFDTEPPLEIRFKDRDDVLKTIRESRGSGSPSDWHSDRSAFISAVESVEVSKRRQRQERKKQLLEETLRGGEILETLEITPEELDELVQGGTEISAFFTEDEITEISKGLDFSNN
jgi:hypothetical protein